MLDPSRSMNAGSTRFELASGSPDSEFTGNYQNGQRGYAAPALGRSSSFREGSDSRNAGSSKINSRVSGTATRDSPTLSQCLMLDPIVMGPKYVRSGDLKRVFSFPVGNNSEDNSFASAHLKNSTPVVFEELKRYRASVADSCINASVRAKKWEEHISKLNKYLEVQPSKKQPHRGDILTNERSSGSNLRTGSQMHRSPSEQIQKFDDRTKNVGLSKRLRTSVSEPRAECRNNGVPRQPMVVTKDREMLKDNNADSDVGEEKLRRFPAGEGWDKKMKRKRSAGAAVSRSVENDGDLKRTVHSKLSNESGLQSSDSPHAFRSGASGGSNKLDPLPSPVGSAARVTLKNDQERTVLSRDISGGQMKDRPLGKVNVKLSNREIVKGKASRGPRSGSMATANLSANAPRLTGTLESWEQPQATNKVLPIGGVNNRKRHAVPSSPPFTQWGGQRPQKISRTRRTNLVPVSNHDELPMQPEGCSPSDFGPRISIGVGNNASPFSKSCDTINPTFKLKSENVSSPARRSESEESGAGESRALDKFSGGRDLEERASNSGNSIGQTSVSIRHTVMVKEEGGDGVKRQGRSGRVSPFSRTSLSPKREKMDNVLSNKPLRNSKFGADKAGSKSGRPLKKLSDRKGFSRLGQMANGASPDYSGESDDDREELMSAAHLACNSSLSVCSKSTFWKAVESFFVPLGPDDKTYLSEQLKLAEEPDTCLSQHFNSNDAVELNSDNCGLNENELKDFSHQMDSSNGCLAAGKRYDVVTPLYQRVLSALILDDDIEECEETGFGRSRSLMNEPNTFMVGDNKFIDGSDISGRASVAQTQINGNAPKIFPCSGSVGIGRSPSVQEHICNGDLMGSEAGYMHSEVEVLVRLSRCDYIPQNLLARNVGISPIGFQYEQACIEDRLTFELHSIGLFVETVPALEDKEEHVISREISQLERLLQEKIGKKKACLAKINKVIQEGNDLQRDPEQVAMDKLVELTYRKLLSTRGSLAAKFGVAKVKKQIALAFARRTLARCHKFEDSGTSCFSEPAMREIIYTLPPKLPENISFVDMLEKNGSMSNRGKKKEVFLDDVGGGSVSRMSASLGIIGGAKGKRSERDSSNKNSAAKAGRALVGGSKGERRTKTKPKQRTAQLSTSGNAYLPKFTDAAAAAAANSSLYPSGSGSGESGNNSGNKKKDVRFMSTSNPPSVSSSQEVKGSLDFGNLPINDLDGMAELGVDSELGAPQDLNSWFNFDVDGLQDHDSIGLEIPMDDLADLNMF